MVFFLAFLLGLLECKIKTMLASRLWDRGTEAVGKGWFFFFFKADPIWGTELPAFSCIISFNLQYLSFASSCWCAEFTHTSQVLYRDITAPWLSFQMSEVPAEKCLPHVANLFSKLTKQSVDQSHQPLYHTQSSAEKERPGYLSLAVPTIPSHQARAGTRRSWASLCQTDWG